MGYMGNVMLTLHSPAKINLTLQILGKRSDGYHELQSLFQTISLCDTIRIRLAGQDRFTCNDPNLPTDSSNLVIAALEKFRRSSYVLRIGRHQLGNRF